jgi:hypothetical protein
MQGNEHTMETQLEPLCNNAHDTCAGEDLLQPYCGHGFNCEMLQSLTRQRTDAGATANADREPILQPGKLKPIKTLAKCDAKAMARKSRVPPVPSTPAMLDFAGMLLPSGYSLMHNFFS